MSRSYRKPYGTYTGSYSCRQDKQWANRGVRQAAKRWLRRHWNDEDFGLIPHRYECRNNDVWGWDYDGPKRLLVPNTKDWSEYQLYLQGFTPVYWSQIGWPPPWYAELRRK